MRKQLRLWMEAGGFSASSLGAGRNGGGFPHSDVSPRGAIGGVGHRGGGGASLDAAVIVIVAE